MPQQLYSIDTSALIDAWVRYYPPDVFSTLWEQLDGLAVDGRITAPDDVLLELKRGGDDLFKWAKARPHIFNTTTEPVENSVTHIVNTYPTFLPATSHDGIWADPYVIAQAATTGAIVVTGEKPAGLGSKRIKIPNVCEAMRIECYSFLDLVRAERWRF
jgi:hypothetical protein